MSNLWKIFLLIQPFAGSFLVNFLGGNSMRPSNWYNSLKRSPLTPPPIVFPIAWTILYILLGMNAFFMYNAISKLNRPAFFDKLFIKDYFVAYEVQLLLNFSWSFFFFAFKKPAISLGIVIGMILLTAYLLWKSWQTSKQAFITLLPYFLWILFAAYLNYYIVFNN